jgi:hypothetical protein
MRLLGSEDLTLDFRELQPLQATETRRRLLVVPRSPRVS